MEARLQAHAQFPAYESLAERFQADLAEERDVLLSRAAVLMFLQESASGVGRSPDG